jgi:hypothetical protein
MEDKSKWRVFREQISEDPQIVGTFIIGAVILLGEFLSNLFGAEKISIATVLPRAIGLLALFGGLVFYFYRAYRTAQWILAAKHVPVVFIAGRPREEAEATLKKAQETITRQTGFKEFKHIESRLNVSYRDLTVHGKQKLKPDFAEWKDFIDDGQWQIRRFVDRVSGDKVYHVFIYGPASLALGLGVVFGSKHRLIAYQYSDGAYQPVIDLSHDIRRIKEKKQTENKFIQVKLPTQLAADTAVVLDLASHPDEGDVSSYLKSANQSMATVEVGNTYGGHLKVPDWAPVVQEVYGVFTQIEATEGVSRIHLFQSMPVAMAFGLGVALGNFKPITVYNWEAQQKTYYPVLKLNELQSII